MISNTLFCNVQSYITRWLVIRWNLKFKWVFIQIYSSWIIPQKNNLVLKIYDLDDSETDDNDRDRLGFSCPFCQELFDETDLAKEHVIKHHSDEENRSVADDEDEDLYSCPFCALVFDNSIDARSHK